MIATSPLTAARVTDVGGNGIRDERRAPEPLIMNGFPGHSVKQLATGDGTGLCSASSAVGMKGSGTTRAVIPSYNPQPAGPYTPGARCSAA